VKGWRRRGLLLVVAAVAVAVAVAVPLSRGGSSPSPHAPPAVLDITCAAPALGGNLPALVYLPGGYRDSSTHYPVIYFLHGLPAGPSSYQGYGFVAAAVQGDRRRAIVVAPQGARNADSDREYLNWGPTEDWPLAISRDLPHCIDSRFRTIPNRRGRALVGLSAGGFGAFNVGLRRLDTFAAVESWSGYFAATDPSGWHILDLGSRRANRKARVPRERDLDERLALWPTFIGFYVGRQDDRFLQPNLDLDRAFVTERIPHIFSVYPGGHAASLWEREAPRWLGLALDALTAPEPDRTPR
jgi:enterochelin esterase-like enzyme